MKAPRTNAMRLLDLAGITYGVLTYEYDESDLSGLKAAEALKMPPESIYKTLVVQGDRVGHMVCCLPVDREVDLKALATVSGNKRVELIPQKDLLPLTGYLRGGCSPVGMKKQFPTFFEELVLVQEKIAVSAGQRGCQLLIAPDDLIHYLGAKTGAFCRD